ncbi:carbohydrate-binding module family 13 protein [Phycomyces blakesleeanus]
MTSHIDTSNWFYIQSAATGDVISADTHTTDLLRSQVYVCPPKQIDEELWKWDGRFIVNKATEMVLDIRKGRLRLIEDTEICLYNRKEIDQAHNQMWGINEDTSDCFGRPQPGIFLYSHYNNDWVLDIQANPDGANKLILFPHQNIDNDNQRWSLISASELEHPLSGIPTLLSSPNSATDYSSPSNSLPSTPVHELTLGEFSGGLSPAKRGSQSSVTMITIDAYKESHRMVYLESNPRLSDKAIAMAAAYQTWQHWKHDQPHPTMTFVDSQDVRSELQTLAQAEASLVFDQCDQLSNHKETALSLASRLIIQLYENPSSP